MQALALGNEIYRGGAAFKRKVGSRNMSKGCLLVARTIEGSHPPPEVGALRAEHLILAIDRVGTHALEKIWRQASMCRHNVRVRDLTLSEKARLSATLRAKARHQL